jgi:two-component system, NtrC family, sensor kinase
MLGGVAGLRKSLKGQRATFNGVDRRRLQAFVRSLTLLNDPDEVLRCVGDNLYELFGPDLVLVFQAELGREHLTAEYFRGYEPTVVQELAISTNGRLVHWLRDRERCVSLAQELDLLEHLGPDEREILTRLRVQYCAPLVSLGRLIGMIFLGSEDPDWKLMEEDQQLLDVLSAEAALALENSVLHSQQRDRIQRLYRAERLAMAGKMAAGVAHEIRNPLTVISSTVEYILRGIPEDDPRRGLTEAVLHEVARINRTVEGLLSLGRVREARQSAVDVLEPLEQAYLLVTGQAQAKRVRLHKQYGGRRLIVNGDADQLQQVFLNLLLNALQATDPGGSIAIRAETLEDHPPSPAAGGKIQIEIADTGRGINRADLDKIFEPFFTTRPEGSGLGLAICQSIIESHEGEIDIRSKPGQGTTVRVCLPRIA